jgi:hypothetical protein
MSASGKYRLPNQDLPQQLQPGPGGSAGWVEESSASRVSKPKNQCHADQVQFAGPGSGRSRGRLFFRDARLPGPRLPAHAAPGGTGPESCAAACPW